MSILPTFIIYEIEESGERKKLEFQQEYLGDYLQPEKAFIIIRTDLKRIYLWIGAITSVRKRFIISQAANAVQSEIKDQGLPYCKVIAIDQGEEQEEFLNAFGLESREITERLEDMRYLRENERKKIEEAQLFAKREDILKISKLEEIKHHLDSEEKILWVKGSTLELQQNWIKIISKNKRYKGLFKNLDAAKQIELKKYEIRFIITNKKIISLNILNRLFDFSKIPDNIFRLEDDIALLDIKGLLSYEVEEVDGIYNVWFNSEPVNEGFHLFLFNDLSLEDYEKLIEVFTIVLSFRADIPKNVKLKYIRR